MIPKCEICIDVPLELKERLPNKKSKTGNEYRVRRFICPICGYETTIHADGAYDIGIYDNIETMAIQEMRAREDIEKQEKENAEFENRII